MRLLDEYCSAERHYSSTWATQPVATKTFSGNELRGAWEQEHDDEFCCIVVTVLGCGVTRRCETRSVLQNGRRDEIY